MAKPKLPQRAPKAPVRAKKKPLPDAQFPAGVKVGVRAQHGLTQLKRDVADHIADKDNPHETNFLNLTDTPPDYTGASGQSVLVNSSEDGVIFGPPNVPVVTASIVLGIGDGTIEGDTNATDFTGNEYAVGTSLSIPPNSIVRIYHDTIAYDYIGLKDTTIGIGGAYVTVADDYQAVGIGDHGHLDGLADDDHTQYHNDARGDERYYLKSEVDASQAEQDANLADHEADLDNPHEVAHPQVLNQTEDDHHNKIHTHADDAEGGTVRHDAITNRSADYCHPISAITQLQNTLDRKLDDSIAKFVPQSAGGTDEGNVWYDSDTHSLCVRSDIPDVTLNIGTEQHIRIVNRTGATIHNGQAVAYGVNDPATNLPTGVLALAIPNNYPRIAGMATHEILNDQEGWITTFGNVGMDTSGYTPGVALYLSDTVPGELTDTPPDMASRAGGVIHGSADGIFFVSIDNLMSLPTTIGYLGNATIPATITTTPTLIGNFGASGSVISTVDPVAGTVSAEFPGLYRITININLLFTDVNRGRIIYLDVVNDLGTVVKTYPYAVGRNADGFTMTLASPLPLENGRTFHLQIYGSENFSNVETYTCTFDIESIHI